MPGRKLGMQYMLYVLVYVLTLESLKQLRGLSTPPPSPLAGDVTGTHTNSDDYRTINIQNVYKNMVK